MPVPHLIGLCGFPKAGKTEVQLILEHWYGVHPIDDGLQLRQFAVQALGLSWEDVRTQAGKARHTHILGREWQNREILGEIGKVLEDLFGEHIMPFMATRNLFPDQSYSFGSVRKSQGGFYKQQGGVIIGIRNPLATASPFAFDRFDHSLVDYWIDNDAQARGLSNKAGLQDLERKVHDCMASLMDRAAA